MIIDYESTANEIRIPLKHGDSIVRTSQESLADKDQRGAPYERIIIEIEVRRQVKKDGES